MTLRSDLSAKQQYLIDFWVQNAGPEGWVDKSHVNLHRLAQISPNLIMLKSVDQNTWVFTLMGTGIVEEYRQDFTGQTIDEIPYEQCKTLYKAATTDPVTKVVPHIIQGDFCYDENGFLQANEVVIPLSENGTTVTHVLIVCEIERGNSDRALYTPDRPIDFSYQMFPYTQ